VANELFSVGGLSPQARRFHEKQLLARAVPHFVHMRYAYQKGIPARGGNNIQFRRFERIITSTTALTEGTPPAETQATFTEVNFTVDQYGQFSRLSDVAIKQSQDDLVSEYSTNYGEAAGDALDQLMRNGITAGTNVQYASTAGSRGAVGSGQYLTAAEIREAVRTLSRNDVPKVPGSNRYQSILHPDTRFDFFGDSDVVSAYENAGPRSGSENPLFTGDLFDWMGVRFDVTTNARVFPSAGLSGADVYATVVFGDQAYGATKFDALGLALIVKPIGSAGANDPLNQFATIGWKASWAGGILNQTRIVRIEHVASIKNAA
jgi:N4-gp56 family major capsid protein